MIDFCKLFAEAEKSLTGTQKKLDVQSVLGIYYGLNGDGNLRLSFMSQCEPYVLSSTKLLHVTQGQESDGVFWTCFDLMQPTAKNVFYTFCSDLVEAVSNFSRAPEALRVLRNRFNTWKSLFKKDAGNVSEDIVKGLFGELYFLKNFMIPKYGIKNAVLAWGGPDNTHKDFSIGNEWYEIKTIADSSLTVKISSLEQLSSSCPGKLEIIKVESMSQQYNDGECCVLQLIENILSKVEDDETRTLFMERVCSFGFTIADECLCLSKYRVVSMTGYNVDEGFPRVTVDVVPYKEIGKLSYELIINMIEKYKEEE